MDNFKTEPILREKRPKHIWNILIATILLLAIGFLASRISHHHNIEKTYTEIQSKLAFYQAEIQRFQNNQEFFTALLDKKSYLTNGGIPEKKWIDTFYHKPYTIQVFEGDSLIYWNNHWGGLYELPEEGTMMKTQLQGDNLNSIWHTNISIKSSTNTQEDIFVRIVFPIYNKYKKQINPALLSPYQSQFIHVNIIDDKNKSQKMTAETQMPNSLFKIKALEIDGIAQEVEILELSSNTAIADYFWALVSSIFYGLGTIGIGLCFYKGSLVFFQKTHRFAMALGLLIGGLCLQYAIFTYLSVSVAQALSDIFQITANESSVYTYIFYFLFKVYLFSLIAYFIYWYFEPKYLPSFIKQYPIILIVIVLMSISLEVSYIMHTIATLLNINNEFLVFYNLSNLRFSDVLVNATLMLFFIVTTMKNSKILAAIEDNWQWKPIQSIYIIPFALGLSICQYNYWGIVGISIISALLFAVFAVYTYDLSKRKIINIFYLCVQIGLFTFFSAFTFFYFIGYYQDNYFKETLATLAIEKDETMEAEFQALARNIQNDSRVVSYYEHSNTYTILQMSRIIADEHLYATLFGKYQYSLSFYNADNHPMKLEKRPYSVYSTMLNSPNALRVTQEAEHSENIELFFIPDPVGTHTYVLQIEVTSMTKERQPLGYIVVEMQAVPKNINNSIVSAFFGAERTEMDKFLEEAEFAFYKDTTLIWSVNKNILPFKLEKPRNRDTANQQDVLIVPPSQTYEEQLYNGKNILLYHVAGNNEDNRKYYGNVLILVKEQVDTTHIFNLSIFIFCATLMTIFLVFVVLGCIYLYNPFTIFHWAYKHSLDGQIQFLIIGILLISLLFIGYTTISSLNKEYESRNEHLLANKLTQVAALLQDNSNVRELKVNNNIELEINQQNIQEITKLPFHIYDSLGNFYATTIEEVFDRNWIGMRMNPKALYALKYQKRPYFIIEEEIAGYTYLATYVMIRKGDKTIYMNFLYDKNILEAEEVKRREKFLTSLLRTYATVLMLACLIAFVIAHTITNSLRKISEHLKKVSLDKKNEPLKDMRLSSEEITEIVQRYNQMIIDLQNKKVKLEQTERETAWRDMAKQVAHEIKNPLTPMKLKIQMLERLMKTDPVRAQEKFENLSKGIVEQIDNLAAIASEFSNFAQMPPPENEVFDINDLAQSTIAVFQDSEDFHIEYQPLEQSLKVYADKKQMLRVFNNLIKNAAQAIPSDREGHVKVKIENAQDRVFVRISDNGIGISEEVKMKIFTPYFTSKSSGTGIGLYMCKNIIMNAHGAIYFDSIENEGTTFTVELPIYQA